MSPDPNEALVTVTGASGFIGMHCVLQLLEAGFRVRGTLRTPSRGDSIRATMARHVDTANRLEFVEADLGRDRNWAAAVDGATYVLHVASPLPRKPPKHEDELIVPARDGALRVLEAATRSDVRRVVMTSSTAAVLYGRVRDGSKVFDESDWSNLEGSIGAYEKSKTIAERAAWDFVDRLPAERALDLVTINPGMVLGPVLDSDWGTSGELVRKLMKREIPGCPDNRWAMVDVRDVAAMHVAAMTAEGAAGGRFICAMEDAASVRDVALILRRHFAGRGYDIPTRRLPNWLVHLVAVFDQTARLAVSDLGKRQDLSNQRAREVLGFAPRSLEEMVVSMAESLIEHDVV